ncbi:MAG TPA: hypothetical protein VFL62_21495 [Bradyrhizobium sp.]|uniref:hypothetical protein n=1 Tax=Bradyrhizobium sp. TaxID=376 RepID=UPI002D7FF878|nr:hypothetical protein [Bradyrhizobium sp.]HET7888807.1 hypothetical protein [Bradyrhizobium sp.]
MLYLLLGATSRRFGGNSAVDGYLPQSCREARVLGSAPKPYWNLELGGVPSLVMFAQRCASQYQCLKGTGKRPKLELELRPNQR